MSALPPVEALFELPPGVGVRLMRRQDLSAVLRVENACYSNPWPLEIFIRQLDTAWATLALLYNEDDPDTTIAHVVYWIVHDELHLLNIAVHPQHQRRGLARVMMQHLFSVCALRQLQYMTLEVRASNLAARTLYRSLGFEQLTVRRRYYTDNDEDAVVMGLALDAPLRVE